VAAAPRVADLDVQDDNDAAVSVVDALIDACINRGLPSVNAVVLAWAGGVLHSRQADRAADVLGGRKPKNDSDVLRFESLVRLADPASARFAEQVRGLTANQRHRLAEAVLDEAVEIGAEPQAGLVEKVVAWQAAHRVRADLHERAQLIGVQCQLVHGLEDLDDPAAAYQVAATALTEYPASQPGGRQTPEHNDLSAAVLRLARTKQSRHHDPLIDTTIAAAAAGGAAVGLEARIWAAIDLLGEPDQREQALKLTDQIITDLNYRNDLGPVENRWRLLLAFHVGRAGYAAITQQLLGPMLTAPRSPQDEDAARAVLRAVSGPEADIRLQIVGLEAELTELPPDANDDRLRIHHALADDYDHLSDYGRALHHGQQELVLRSRSQGADHRDTQAARRNVARWTWRCDQPAEALRLSQELLPDQERVLGPDHFDTLTIRNNIAVLTERCGHPAEALRLFQELLPDLERVLGRNRPRTLLIRKNIAVLTERCGHPAEALQLFQELLPDQERVLGPSHPDTLRSRGAVQRLRATEADSTGQRNAS
jgi:Tetratricopeptide repeat